MFSRPTRSRVVTPGSIKRERLRASTGEPRLAQSIEEVFAVVGLAISFGSGPSEVEGLRGRGFAIRIQFTAPFADEGACFGLRLA
jgi:hypothetical protein